MTYATRVRWRERFLTSHREGLLTAGERERAELLLATAVTHRELEDSLRADPALTVLCDDEPEEVDKPDEVDKPAPAEELPEPATPPRKRDAVPRHGGGPARRAKPGPAQLTWAEHPHPVAHRPDKYGVTWHDWQLSKRLQVSVRNTMIGSGFAALAVAVLHFMWGVGLAWVGVPLLILGVLLPVWEVWVQGRAVLPTGHPRAGLWTTIAWLVVDGNRRLTAVVILACLTAGMLAFGWISDVGLMVGGAAGFCAAIGARILMGRRVRHVKRIVAAAGPDYLQT